MAAETSDASRPSLLQLLAQSLGSDGEPADPAQAGAKDPASATDKNTAASADSSTQAMALITQALAAAFGASTAVAAATNATPQVSAAGTLPDAVTDVTQSTRGSQGQETLLAILAKDIAADTKSGTGTGSDTAQPAPAAVRDSNVQVDPNAGGPTPLAHLGIASHFAAQNAQTAANTSELKSPVGSAAWTEELGGQLTWMTQKGIETGSLRVSPEHLGPVEVQISVQNGGASVWFGASHPDTRAALEQALPRLREMFASQGMTLTDSGVSRESPRNQTGGNNIQAISALPAQSGVTETAAVRVSLGLVDTYA